MSTDADQVTPTNAKPPRFVVVAMRGYTPKWWVYDNTKTQDRVSNTYASEGRAQRYAQLMNAGVRREVAMEAVSNGAEVIRLGDLVFVDALGTPLIPAKVVTLERVPVPGAPNAAYTQIQVTVKLTAARPGYRRGELITKTGHPEIDSIIPRAAVHVVGGSIRIRSGVFDA